MQFKNLFVGARLLHDKPGQEHPKDTVIVCDIEAPRHAFRVRHKDDLSPASPWLYKSDFKNFTIVPFDLRVAQGNDSEVVAAIDIVALDLAKAEQAAEQHHRQGEGGLTTFSLIQGPLPIEGLGQDLESKSVQWTDDEKSFLATCLGAIVRTGPGFQTVTWYHPQFDESPASMTEAWNSILSEDRQEGSPDNSSDNL